MIERLAVFLTGTSFHRGLALGALVGAAIAGSTLWAKLRSARPDAGEIAAAPAVESGRDRGH